MFRSHRTISSIILQLHNPHSCGPWKIDHVSGRGPFSTERRARLWQIRFKMLISISACMSSEQHCGVMHHYRRCCSCKGCGRAKPDHMCAVFFPHVVRCVECEVTARYRTGLCNQISLFTVGLFVGAVSSLYLSWFRRHSLVMCRLLSVICLYCPLQQMCHTCFHIALVIHEIHYSSFAVYTFLPNNVTRSTFSAACIHNYAY